MPQSARMVLASVQFGAQSFTKSWPNALAYPSKGFRLNIPKATNISVDRADYAIIRPGLSIILMN